MVLLVHGGGATHEMKLPEYELEFSRAGLAVLAFDFRHWGRSPGQPRQLMSSRRFLEDVDAALAFVRSRPELDAARTALWGTSFGASHVLVAAARHPELAAAVVQCPVLRARSVALRSGWRSFARLTWPIASDIVRAMLRRPRRYVPIVGRPGELAFVDRPGALEGWHSLVPAGSVFDNRVAASAGLSMLFYDAAAKAADVRCPLLVCLSDHEELVDATIASRAVADAPCGTALHYPAGHFDVYHAPLFQKIVADQIRFLRAHLRPASDGRPEGAA